jgi:hypothetical protein
MTPTVTIPALGYAVALTLAAVFWSFIGASCLHLKAAWKRQEIRRIEQDWGVHKPRPAGHTPTCLEGNPPLTHTLP